MRPASALGRHLHNAVRSIAAHYANSTSDRARPKAAVHIRRRPDVQASAAPRNGPSDYKCRRRLLGRSLVVSRTALFCPPKIGPKDKKGFDPNSVALER